MSAMSRLHLYLPMSLVKKLKAIATKEGVGVSEVIRRILFAHFD